MKVRGGIGSCKAFTRIDLVVIVLVACLGAALANPLFTSHSRARADSIVCQANLAQIGRAYQLWGNDHDDLVPYLVSAQNGGLRQHPLAANIYIQFAWVSNGLMTPKVLVCPADTNTTRRAKDFSTNPDGGFMHPGYRNNAVSYMLSFHAGRHFPRSILSADSNIDGTSIEGCSFSGFPIPRVSSSPVSGSGWNDAVHGRKGNLVFMDGSVTETSTTELRAALGPPDDAPGAAGGGRIHALFPR